MFTAAALTLIVNVATSLLKWSYDRVGKVGSQIIVFVFALVAALFWTYQAQVPGLVEYAKATIGIFCLAVAFYEVILSRIAFFKGPTGN